MILAAVTGKSEDGSLSEIHSDCTTNTDTTKCMFVGETCAQATKDMYESSKDAAQRKRLQSLMAIQSTYAVADIEAAASTMRTRNRLGLAYLAWNLLKQGYLVMLDDLREGFLTVKLWQPIFNVTHVDKDIFGGRLLFQHEGLDPDFRLHSYSKEELETSISFMELLEFCTPFRCSLVS